MARRIGLTITQKETGEQKAKEPRETKEQKAKEPRETTEQKAGQKGK